MRRFICSMMFAACVAAPGLAAAQGSQAAQATLSVPHAASNAFFVDVGAFNPRTNQLDGSLLMDVGYEYYLSPNLSWRTVFGWTNPGFNGPGIDSVRQIPLRVDVNYNWPSGQWIPFVSGGLGVHLLQFRNNGSKLGGTEAEPGISLGGGAEYFLNRAVSWKGEVRYQAVGNTRGLDTSGLAVSFGVKTYF